MLGHFSKSDARLRWFLIFNPFISLKLLLLVVCVFTIGFLLAINVLIVELNGAKGSRHMIASDPEHVYSPPVQHHSAIRHTNKQAL